MTVLTFAQVHEDFRLAGCHPTYDHKDPLRFYALCPVCPGEIAVIADDDGYKLACSNDCDRSRIADALYERRKHAPDSLAGEPGTRERRFIRGGEFVLDAPEVIPAAWGAGDDVLHAQGEPLIICGPPGVGKTTLAQQLVLHRLGVHKDKLLGFPVAVDERPVLYVAADRPEQARRSLRRMVKPEHRTLLDMRLLAWRGPLPFTLLDDPARLAEWAAEQGAGMVVLDSLKDMAVGIADDAVGAAVNQALQHLVSSGIEVVALHHQRKGQDGRKPRHLEDVYGSTWITAGAGSVLLMWGQAGDAYVELLHLKQPAGDVGPLTVHHDHARGTCSLPEPVDLLDLAARGVTATDAAEALYDTSSPDRNQRERARRRLERLVDVGAVTRREPDKPGDPVTYWLAAVTPRDPLRDPPHAHVTQGHDLAPELVTDKVTQGHATPEPPFKGGRGVDRDPDADRAERLLTDHHDLNGSEAA